MYLLFVDNIECFLVRVFQLLKRGTWSPKLVKLLINDLAALQLSDNVQLSTETILFIGQQEGNSRQPVAEA